MRFYVSLRSEVAIVKELVSAGADVNAAGNSGMTALFAACRRSEVAIVKELLSAGADANAAGNVGWTALFLACRAGEVAIVKELLSAGADVNAASNCGGTAFFVACGVGKVAIVKELLSAGAGVNAADNNGRTPVSPLLFAVGGAGPTFAVAVVRRHMAELPGEPVGHIVRDLEEWCRLQHTARLLGGFTRDGRRRFSVVKAVQGRRVLLHASCPCADAGSDAVRQEEVKAHTLFEGLCSSLMAELPGEPVGHVVRDLEEWCRQQQTARLLGGFTRDGRRRFSEVKAVQGRRVLLHASCSCVDAGSDAVRQEEVKALSRTVELLIAYRCPPVVVGHFRYPGDDDDNGDDAAAGGCRPLRDRFPSSRVFASQLSDLLPPTLSVSFASDLADAALNKCEQRALSMVAGVVVYDGFRGLLAGTASTTRLPQLAEAVCLSPQCRESIETARRGSQVVVLENLLRFEGEHNGSEGTARALSMVAGVVVYDGFRGLLAGTASTTRLPQLAEAARRGSQVVVLENLLRFEGEHNGSEGTARALSMVAGVVVYDGFRGLLAGTASTTRLPQLAEAVCLGPQCRESIETVSFLLPAPKLPCVTCFAGSARLLGDRAHALLEFVSLSDEVLLAGRPAAAYLLAAERRLIPGPFAPAISTADLSIPEIAEEELRCIVRAFALSAELGRSLTAPVDHCVSIKLKRKATPSSSPHANRPRIVQRLCVAGPDTLQARIGREYVGVGPVTVRGYHRRLAGGGTAVVVGCLGAPLAAERDLCPTLSLMRLLAAEGVPSGGQVVFVGPFPAHEGLDLKGARRLPDEKTVYSLLAPRPQPDP
ncbi:putative ankyrin repeat protein L93 [Diplonema papillatum]|nr:putative ankyrin repeat protein L93 [Diplonema papillatum]